LGACTGEEASVPGYAAALAELGDAELAGMLARRPDLLGEGGPASFPELASRAGSPASLSAALRQLDLGALRLAELLAVVGLPTTVDVIAKAAGPGLKSWRLHDGLAALAELGIALPRPDGVVAGPRGLAAPFGNPGGLGPSVAELARIGVRRDQLEQVAGTLGLERQAGKPQLVASVAAALANPRVVAKLLARADEAARRLLDQALRTAGPLTVMGVGYGRYAGYPDAAPAAWLAEHGLLMPVAYNQLVIPREAVMGMRGGHVFPDWPTEPVQPRPTPMPDAAGRAAASALRAAVAAEGLVVRLDREPLALIQAGTVAVRDLRRLAGELDLGEDEAAVLIDLLVEAEVLGVGGPWDKRSLGLRPEADGWLARTRAERWAELAVAWRDRDLAVDDHLLRRHGAAQDGVDKPRPLVGRRLSAAGARRRGLIEFLAGLPDPAALPAEVVGELLGWRRPLLWDDHRDDQAMAVLDTAVLLGLAAVEGGRAAAGPASAAWSGGAGCEELAATMAGLLPDGAHRFLVAGDLTVVAPGGLAPEVESRLVVLAERETGGGAVTWRVTDASLRRALDEGRTGEQVLAFLREHSDTPLPQALEYLVDEAARRHGRLRIGPAVTYLHGEPPLVTQTVRSAAGRRLGLRELAPGVAVTQRSQRELLAELRKAGEAPVVEEPDGTARVQGRRAVRHSPRPAAERRGRPPAKTTADPAEVVANLRAASGHPAAGRRVASQATPPDRGTVARGRSANGEAGVAADAAASRPAPAREPACNGRPAAAAPPTRSGPPRGAGEPAASTTVTAPAEIAALCKHAADTNTAVEMAYRRRDGEETTRVIEPSMLRAGLVTAWCRLRQDERTFDLSRILWARPARGPGAAPGGSAGGPGVAPERPGGAPRG
jgi:Helicase conserved C-terminal domain/WYL domain